jgi:hypothetical protein
MGLAGLVRKSVALANKLTKDLQVPVIHEAWIGNDTTYGTPLYAAPIRRLALVEMKQRTLRSNTGMEITQRATVTFLYPIPANGAADRQEPLDIRDKLTLPSGYSGPIRIIEGLENNYPDSPYLLEVILG